MPNPLTGRTTQGAEGMVISLLKYANREKVAQALSAQGYSVTRMTVNRWARGAEIPTAAQRMILELFLHPGDSKEALPPPWARGLEERLTAVLVASLESTLEEQLAIYGYRRARDELFDDADAPETQDDPPKPAVQRRGR